MKLTPGGEAIVERKRQEQVMREQENLAALQRDVERARAWARNRWPAPTERPGHDAPVGAFLDWMCGAAFEVNFPDIDRMTVTPVSCDEAMAGLKAEFRLTWLEGWLYWIGDIVVRKELWGVEGELRHIVGRAEGKPQ